MIKCVEFNKAYLNFTNGSGLNGNIVILKQEFFSVETLLFTDSIQIENSFVTRILSEDWNSIISLKMNVLKLFLLYPKVVLYKFIVYDSGLLHILQRQYSSCIAKYLPLLTEKFNKEFACICFLKVF